MVLTPGKLAGLKAITNSDGGVAALALDQRGILRKALCGRATWQDGVLVYAKRGAKALEQWLAKSGVENISRVNEALKATQPWHDRVSVPA